MSSKVIPPRKKIYAIMQVPPPIHGSAKVSQFIKDNLFINKKLDILYSPIRVANDFQDIGKFRLNKIFITFLHFFKIFYELFLFKPDAVYFTASPSGFAFYRDILFIIPIKIYSMLFKKNYYLHYHTRGVEKFISKSALNKTLGKILLSDANLILLDETLSDEFYSLAANSKISYLPNCTEDPFPNKSFEDFIKVKFKHKKDIVNFLYMANMMESKGYKEILEFAAENKDKNFRFNFAGAWEAKNGEKEFYDFIKLNDLEGLVTYHGLVSGKAKDSLFKTANIFLFPTKYHNESLPLCIIEALSYGVPVISTKVGAIPNMLNSEIGILMDTSKDLQKHLHEINGFLNQFDTALKSRYHYENYFSTKKFEKNFLSIFQE